MPTISDATQKFVKEHTPRVVFQPQTHQAMQRGINLLVDAIRPTLGPQPRSVAVEEPERNRIPELIDNGALIARRVVEISDPDADMGVMLLRQMLWKLYETQGDGTASAAVIFQTVFNEGLRIIAAGGNSQRLRTHLLSGLLVVLDHLQTLSKPLQGRDQLRHFACSITHDGELAEILAEVFDVLGSYAEINLRSAYTEVYTREYLYGMMWASGVHTANMLLDSQQQKTVLDYTAILATDFQFDDPNELVPIIDTVAPHYSALVITASQVSEKVAGLVHYINQQPKPFKLIIVKLPLDRIEQSDMLDEIALTSGGQVLRQDFGDHPGAIRLEHIGRARRIWANRDYFCIEEPVEETTAARNDFLLDLQARYTSASEEQRVRLRKRIGRLQGASAIIYVGGIGEREIRDRKETLERYIRVIRGAYETGIMPGAGAALLNCCEIMNDLLQTAREYEEKAAYRILMQALAAPSRTILENAGHHPDIIFKDSSPGFLSLDSWGDPLWTRETQVIDSAAVVMNSFESAVRTVALALSVDVLVHHRKPEFSATP